MTVFQGLKERFYNNFIIRLLSRRTANYIILIVVFFLVVFLSVLASLSPEKYELRVGQASPVDLRAPRDIEDRAATEKLIQSAVELVEPREKIDPSIQINIKKQIESFFRNVYNTKELDEKTLEEKLVLLKQINQLNLNDNELLLVLNTDNEVLKETERHINEIVVQIMSSGIKAEEIEKEKKNIEAYFNGLKEIPEKLKLLAINIVNSSIKANRFLDEETTRQKIEEAKNSVEKVIVKRGSIIVSEGEIITWENLQILQDAGLTKEDSNINYSLYFGIGLLVLILMLLMIAYMFVFNYEIFTSISKLYLLLIIFISGYLISKAIFSISPYLAPVAVSAMLLGILLDSRMAIAVNLITAILLSMVTGNNLVLLISSLIGGTVGAFCVTHTHQRSNIFFSGLAVSLSNMITIFALGLMNGSDLSKLVTESFYGVLNGIFCAVLTIGSLPLWETGFRILTPLKLLELSNPNQPVLKKLLLEAPGTYHHSVIVGNLGEAAADAIAANGLFTRVSAYYHDIGKLKRPYFFKENQLTSENPHDKLTPSLSTKIITDHVKDGIAYAKNYRLPIEIIDVIEQHHGTTLVKFFYHKALNSDEHETVEHEQFRYSGVKPQTREAAIVMLADSVEAAVRSIAEPNAEKIKTLIDKIIEDKLKDHQLDECDLTLKDLERISNAFSVVLMGIFHERIEYPELNAKEPEEAK